MKTFLLYDKDLIIRAISSTEIRSEEFYSITVSGKIEEWAKLIYKKLPENIQKLIGINPKKNHKELRIALVCNWNDKCGISTYSKFLYNSLQNKVKHIKIFSEINNEKMDEKENVVKCWERGETLKPMTLLIKEWKPDLVIIQHEYGIFPNAFKFMQMIEDLENIPYIVVMHSVYKHTDKAIYSECAKNIVVHSKEAKNVLKEMGNTNNINIIPHGCIEIQNKEEIWNIFQNPYTIIQFGFGFSYKGIDRALRAIAHLKFLDKKFHNIQYIYLCSTNSHNNSANTEYCKELKRLAQEIDVENNFVIIKKYQTDEMINKYLRMAKIAIFPYVTDPNNDVYGASGATRIALANEIPTIASKSNLFNDLEGIIPRPKNHIELAQEIDKIFSISEYRNNIINKSIKFIKDNNWDITADRYLEVYDQIINQE